MAEIIMNFRMEESLKKDIERGGAPAGRLRAQ